MEKQEKQSFDFEAFKKQAASRIKKGETLLSLVFRKLSNAILRLLSQDRPAARAVKTGHEGFFKSSQKNRLYRKSIFTSPQGFLK